MALAFAEITQAEWARREGLQEPTVSEVISGVRPSSQVLERALAFIAEQETAMRDLPPLEDELDLGGGAGPGAGAPAAAA